MMKQEKADFHYNSQLREYTCRLCGERFHVEDIVAWEIHKLNHTLVALKNILIKVISK